MNIHNSLISTALLALQQQRQMQFTGKLGGTIPHTGFYRSELPLTADRLGEYSTLIYMTSKSPTGYGIRIEAIAENPPLLLTDRHLETFEDFEDAIEHDYSITATKATRRRQLGK